MPYPDFVYFMLAEEDKTSVQSIRFGFRCCDLDGDGVLSPRKCSISIAINCTMLSWGRSLSSLATCSVSWWT